MPTNFLRTTAKAELAPAQQRPGPARHIVIRAGRVTIRARLLDTATANLIFAALPLHSTAETWGQSINFEVPVETGREPGARATIDAGEIAFWTEDDRIVIGFGPTPLSKGAEIRLAKRCNVWAIALDPVTPLKSVVAGEKVSVHAG